MSRLPPWSRRSLASATLGAGAALAGVGLTSTAAWLISRAAEHPNVAALSLAIVGVRFFGVLRAVLRYLERVIGHDAALRDLTDTRVRVYRKLERLAPAGLPAFRRGDLLVRIVDDVDSRLTMMLGVLPPYIVALGAGAVTACLLVLLLPEAATFFLCALVLSATAVATLCAWLVQHTESRRAQDRGDLSTVVVDLLEGAPDLLLHGAVEDQLQRAEALDARLTRHARSVSRTAGAGQSLTLLLGGAAAWAALTAGVAAVGAGRLHSTLLAVVVLTPLAAAELLPGLPLAAATWRRERQSTSRLEAVMAAPDPVREPTQPVACPPAPYVLHLEEVRARYGAAGGWALQGVDLDLSPGRAIAVVGPSGAGKSTLVAVLVRFLDIASGSATLNGVPLADLSGEAVRRVVGLCEQGAHVFDTTLAENLRVARPEASEQDLMGVLDRVALLDWVRELPLGVDTRVGERGHRLSGGQRQRLVVARTLLAEFPVLLLDEPTEHLDPAAGDALMAELRQVGEDRSLLVVTHRLTGLLDMDEILVMEGGRVAERGRHDELVDLGGWYARQWTREVDCELSVHPRARIILPG
ncbi:MAG: ATP-binding cassette, subfamily bacterial CydC [Nocardioidaceae bacterium]|nr:ATP-binding cassette, subfamily bacterial CydC [Nocardioidaceae bacterium]